MSTDDLRPPLFPRSVVAIRGTMHAPSAPKGAPDPSRRGVAEGGVLWTPEAPRRNTQSTGARIHAAPPDPGPHRRPGQGDAFCRRDASSCLSAFCGPAMPPLPTPTQLTVPPLSRVRIYASPWTRATCCPVPGALTASVPGDCLAPTLPAASPPDLGAAS
ncbi:hypothetical protein PAPYR_10506 [Paratrimastix pyriformis]|uniref:Uncharacterized protein n=1 Tax=Paratrimastix pyriformis TaxID=342808 RepID=A0ABQ8UCZ5_9EUKA|nr:hypothetical protein PAPYR_10506 [Paratrimastix pyriformis]